MCAKKVWLNEEIKFKHKELSLVEEELYSLHWLLLKKEEYHSAAECFVHRCVEENKECWQKSLYHIERNLSKRVREIKQKHNKKLIALARSQTPDKTSKSPQTIDGFVVNLSSVQLSEPELQLLNKGLNFAISPPHAPLEEIVCNIENAIQYNDSLSKSATRHDVKQCLLRAAKNNTGAKSTKFEDWCTIKSLKARDVIFSRADKGNAIVILDKEDYNSRVVEMIETGPYEVMKYKNGKPKNPLNAMIEEANVVRQRVAHLVGDEKLERRLLVSNPKVASLYCLPKIHKNPLKMRPIASNICTPSEKMAAWLVEEMTKYPITHGRSVRNSIELVNKLKNVEVKRGEIMISFDITSLFPSIPVPDALKSLRAHLERKRVPPNYIDAYMAIANLCMQQNLFSFRGNFYRQVFGLSMGNKLSPLLAEIFMCDLEAKLEKDKLFPRVWLRYVDDVFALVKERYVSQVLNLLNSQHSTIKFTVEREVDSKIPFLDLLVTRKDDNRLKFSIYRKPMSTDRYITSDSNHFGSQKQAAFHSMAHRLMSIPMETEDFINELNHIHKAAQLNGYDKKFVDKIIKKHARKKNRENTTTLEPEVKTVKRISMPFYPKVTDPLKNTLKRHDLCVVYKSGNTLRDLLCNQKDRIPPDEKSGIYKISCGECSAVYLGQTKRRFKTRLREHKNATENNRINESSVAKHSINFQHAINWNNAKLIKNIRNVGHLNAWESMHISTETLDLMNEEEPPIISPLFNLTKLKL